MPNTIMPAIPQTGDTLLVFGDGGRYAGAFRDQLADHLLPVGGVEVEEVDVWSAGSKAVEYGVKSLPTAVLLRDGDERARLVGPASRRRITEFATSLGASGSPSDPRTVPTTSTAASRSVAVGG